jgi:hypothetical protein
MRAGLPRLFLIYALAFVLGAATAWLTLGSVPLLAAPLTGIVAFHLVFTFGARQPFGVTILAIAAGLVYGAMLVAFGMVYWGLFTPTAAAMLWLVLVFAPGWWLAAALLAPSADGRP